MRDLTPKQQEVLSVIRRYISSHGYPPTYKEIAKEMGIKSCNGAYEHVKSLSDKGAVRLVKGASRGMQIVEEGMGREWVSCRDRLPEVFRRCDWIFPESTIKRERRVLVGESMASSSSHSGATHWRPHNPGDWPE